MYVREIEFFNPQQVVLRVSLVRYTNIYQDKHLFLELRDDHTFLMYGSGGGWLGLKNHMFCTVRKMQKYLDAP